MRWSISLGLLALLLCSPAYAQTTAAALTLQPFPENSLLETYDQPIFQHLKTDPCPVTERVAATILNPPMFHGLTAVQQKRIANELRTILEALPLRERTLREAS